MLGFALLNANLQEIWVLRVSLVDQVMARRMVKPIHPDKTADRLHGVMVQPDVQVIVF